VNVGVILRLLGVADNQDLPRRHASLVGVHILGRVRLLFTGGGSQPTVGNPKKKENGGQQGESSVAQRVHEFLPWMHLARLFPPCLIFSELSRVVDDERGKRLRTENSVTSAVHGSLSEFSRKSPERFVKKLLAIFREW
jgi:hypothetical protein